MGKPDQKVRVLSVLFLLFSSFGCANRMDIRQTVPEINETRSTSKLEELSGVPKPERKIIVTVYRFQDKTGQFNDSDKLRYSTAVTQGATSQLITALMRANYFTVVERAHLDDIITEQKLKIEKRVLLSTGPDVGKMYGAEYIITGDITEYNVDVITAGAGVRVSGAGGSAQVAVATAAVDLRVVESTTGRIVFNKSLRKSIVGKQVGVNIFRFWDNRLYEINGGIANQEPIQLAIRELLEEGVYMLVSSYAKAYEQNKVARKQPAENSRVAQVAPKPAPVKPSPKSPVPGNRKAAGKETLASSKKPTRGSTTLAAASHPRIKTAPVSQKTPVWAKNLLQARVKAEGVNVRIGPGLEYRKTFQVAQNQVVYVLEKNLVWNLVKTASGAQGWIRTDKIEIIGGSLSTVTGVPEVQKISGPEGTEGGAGIVKKPKNYI